MEVVRKDLNQNYKIIYIDIPNKLYEALAEAKEICGIYFCSPWLSELSVENFTKLIQGKSKNRRFEILTRPPEKKWHREILQNLYEECGAKIYVNSVLHAKFFIVIARHGTFAIFGSPNLTETSRNNIEIAIFSYDTLFVDRLLNIFQIHFKPLCKYWR